MYEFYDLIFTFLSFSYAYLSYILRFTLSVLPPSPLGTAWVRARCLDQSVAARVNERTKLRVGMVGSGRYTATATGQPKSSAGTACRLSTQFATQAVDEPNRRPVQDS